MTTFIIILLAGFGLLGLTSPAAADEPGPANDYARAEIGGSQGPIVWESLLHGDGLDGWEMQDSPWTPTGWSREGDTIIGKVGRGKAALLTQGNNTWISYEVKVQATLVEGGGGAAFQVHFSILDNREDSYHFATLTGWQAAAIIEQDWTKLDVENFIWERGREYDVVIAVRGNSIKSYIDGNLVNSVTVQTPPRGGVGLAIWGGTAHFRDPKIRIYFRDKN